MKKIFNIVVLLFSIVAFISCSNEESVSVHSSIKEKFAICKDAATYHSAGLDFAYNQFRKIREKENLRSSKNVFTQLSKEEKLDLINASVTEFLSQEKIISNLTEYDNKIRLTKAEKFRSDTNGFRSGNRLELTPDEINLLSFFDQIVDAITDISEVESVIESAIQSEEFAFFTENEQNELLLMFATYEDSSKYWEENMANWLELFNGEESNVSFRSSVTAPAEDWDIDLLTQKNAWKADGAGLLGGLIGGAIFGSTLGPAGTIIGSVGGGLEGAIASSIAHLLTPNMTKIPYISSQEVVTVYFKY
ncbi:MAG: hypothetical protein LBP72_10235 [Dysgonamonadaceae bacterium]|jgi:hypothetical protein|nr:hypothetical protein [Dysgonamonadaceae bacterium]